MPITFNGHPLLLEDPEGTVAKFVRRHWRIPHTAINSPPRATDPKSYCQAPNWPAMPPLKLNQLYIPSGATRWARGLFVVDTATAATLANTSGLLVFQTLDLYPNTPVSATITPAVGEDPAVTLDWNLNERVRMQMYALQPIPVSDHDGGTDPGLWILPLVDERYFWQGRLTNSTATTWEGLLNELTFSLSAGSPLSPIEYIQRQLEIDDPPWVVQLADPLNSVPDPCVFRNGPINTATALDLACWALGLRLVPQDLSTSDYTRFQLVNASPRGTEYPTSAAIYEAQVAALKSKYGNCASGESRTAPDSADIPNRIRMLFGDDYLAEYQIAAGGGHRRDVWCPAVVEEAIGGTPENSADLDLITEFFGTKWELLFAKSFHWTWNGTPCLRFSGYEDYILYEMTRRPGGGYVALTHQRSLPRDVGWEYVPAQLPEYANRNCTATGSGAGGGGGSTNACGCCDCFDCITPAEAEITTCAECPNGAALRYTVDVGSWVAYPTLGGVVTLKNFACGCTWRSDIITIAGYGYGGDALYRWELTQAGAGSTLQLVWIGGPDPLGLKAGGGHEMIYVANGPWSCLCSSKMRAQEPGLFPSPTGLNCEVCVIPAETGNICFNPDACLMFAIEGIAGPGTADVSGTFSAGFPSLGDITFTNENGFEAIFSEFMFGILGCGSYLTFYKDRINEPDQYVRYRIRSCFTCAAAAFTMDQGEIIGGQDVPAMNWTDATGFPATITLKPILCSDVPDCNAVDPPPECGGACIYRAVDENGSPPAPPFTGPWFWSDPNANNDNYCNPGCACPGPPTDPPTGPSDFYAAECV